MADPVERYLELGLRLGRHAEDLSTPTTGRRSSPGGSRPRSRASPAALAEDADALAAELAGDDRGSPRRCAALERERPQARRRAARLRRGGSARLRDRAPLARRGAVPPGGRDPRRGAAGRAATLRERYARWFEETAIPAELVEQAVLDAAAELRRLTREAIGPAGGRGVRARARHRRALARLRALPRRPAHAGSRSTPTCRCRRPTSCTLTSHEIYGGHHTHRVWQEIELVRGQGQLERTLDLLWSPEAVISEGIAMTGPELLVGDGQQLAAEVLGRLGFAYDAEVGSRVVNARRSLLPIAANVAMLLHDRGASPEEAREYSAHVVAAAGRPRGQAGRLAAARARRRRTSTPTGRAASSSRRTSAATRSASARC